MTAGLGMLKIAIGWVLIASSIAIVYSQFIRPRFVGPQFSGDFSNGFVVQANDSVEVERFLQVGPWTPRAAIEPEPTIQAILITGPSICSQCLIESRIYAAKLLERGVPVKAVVPKGSREQIEHFALASRIDAPFFTLDSMSARALLSWAGQPSDSPQIAFVDANRREVFFRINLLNYVTTDEDKSNALNIMSRLVAARAIQSPPTSSIRASETSFQLQNQSKL